jgi:hypothetical protein
MNAAERWQRRLATGLSLNNSVEPRMDTNENAVVVEYPEKALNGDACVSIGESGPFL